MLSTTTVKQKLHIKTTCKIFATIIVDINIDGFQSIDVPSFLLSCFSKIMIYIGSNASDRYDIETRKTNSNNVRNVANIFYFKRRAKTQSQ